MTRPWPKLASILMAASVAIDAGGAPTKSSVASCSWDDAFFHGVNGTIFALATYDDGDGPGLYSGGYFSFARQERANGVARWDGGQWSALPGPGGIGMAPSHPDWAPVFDLATFDDGDGPGLYAAGAFDTAGSVSVDGVARWDGQQWSPLTGAGGTGVIGFATVAATYDDGDGVDLYVGGRFLTAGGVPVNGIARWDGTAWSALEDPGGIGLSGSGIAGAEALAVFDDGSGPALYVGGSFPIAGGIAANNIARWDGSQWSPLPGVAEVGTDGAVLALAVYDDGSGPALYVGGTFERAGGITAHTMARWDGQQWQALGWGDEFGDHVSTLAVFDHDTGPALYAGGDFDTVSGVAWNHIARWNGAAWTPLVGPGGPGVAGVGARVHDLEVFDDGAGPRLFVAGDFATVGGISARRVATWDGTAWAPLVGGVGAGLDSLLRAFAVHDDGGGPTLYATGPLFSAGSAAGRGVFRWLGDDWQFLASPSGNGITAAAYTAHSHDDGSGPALHVGGDLEIDGQSHGLARWDGTDWRAVAEAGGSGLDGRAHALATFDDGSGPALYAAGLFTTADGVTVNRIARWDGSTWAPLIGPGGPGVSGAPVNTIVRALAIFDEGTGPALFVAGEFFTAGGLPASNIAKWDGTTWSVLAGAQGVGVNDDVYALAVYDDGSGLALFVGGDFSLAGGIFVNHLAKWDGTDWSPVATPGGVGVNGSVQALAVFDDGASVHLAVGGSFQQAGGITANNLARWDGTSWHPFGDRTPGTDRYVNALTTFEDAAGPALWVGGFFNSAGGLSSSMVARWLCQPVLFHDGFDTGDTSAWSATVP